MRKPRNGNSSMDRNFWTAGFTPFIQHILDFIEQFFGNNPHWNLFLFEKQKRHDHNEELTALIIPVYFPPRTITIGEQAQGGIRCRRRKAGFQTDIR